MPVLSLISTITIFSLVFSPVFSVPGKTQNKPQNAQKTQPQKPDKTNHQSPASDNGKQTEFEKLLDDELNENGNANNAKTNEDSSWAFQILKTIAGLSFVIFTIYLLKKYVMFKSQFKVNEAGIINVLHDFPVSTGKKLQILEVGNKLLLIGISDAGIQLVTEFKEKVTIDQIKMDCEKVSKTENTDIWLEMSKVISDKIQGVFKKKTDDSDHADMPETWKDLQANARFKIDEIREKKKFFEDFSESYDRDNENRDRDTKP